MTEVQPKVLIVEDSTDVSQVLKDVLTAEGFNCVVAEDGQKAINRINSAARNEIGWVIADYGIPGKNGIEVLKAAATRDARCALMSGHPAKSFDGFDSATMTDMQKPPDLGALITWLRTGKYNPAPSRYR